MLRKFEESRRSGEFANGGGGGGGIRGGGSGGGSSGPLTRRSGGGVRQSKFMETFGESVRTLVGMNVSLCLMNLFSTEVLNLWVAAENTY